ncbi:MAG: alpha/beta fold hydrolase [Halobacteriota archaeon]
MTNNIAAGNVENCHNLVVGNVRNYGPPDCSYRLWHSDVIVPGNPNTILVHGASIRLLGTLPILGHIRERPNNCFCQLGTLLHNELNGGHNVWEFEYADELFVGPFTHENVYFNFGDLTTYGKRLIQAIGTVRNCNPGVNVNIIAHSMGGLVARYAAQNIQNGPVNKVVTLDTGHFGFDMAAFFDLFVQNLPKEIRDNALCVDQTAPGSEFLNTLNRNFRHCTVKLLSLAAGEPLLGITVVTLASSHLGQVSNDGSISYNEECTPYDIVQNVNHLSFIEINDERHPAFELIKNFTIEHHI